MRNICIPLLICSWISRNLKLFLSQWKIRKNERKRTASYVPLAFPDSNHPIKIQFNFAYKWKFNSTNNFNVTFVNILLALTFIVNSYPFPLFVSYLQPNRHYDVGFGSSPKLISTILYALRISDEKNGPRADGF